MLSVGKKKMLSKKVEHIIDMQLGDSENMPFEEGYFDAITVGFGVRNFENLEKGLLEMLRVTRKGGKVIILEFSKPKRFPIKQVFGFYSKVVIPFLGKRISKDEKAYAYLPESVEAFPEGKAMVDLLKSLGYQHVESTLVSGGIATIYSGVK
jgi:demethylmenaquinone methyltransferase/2-methoxy-6-polyprenyl-1,4-benzoquinol methylase